MSKNLLPVVTTRRPAWNKGRLVGQKRPLQPKQVWAIRARLELEKKLRDLALFNLAIDSKLRGCDLVRLRVNDLVVDDTVRDRVSVVQSKTAKPVQFEVTENTREVVSQWVSSPYMHGQRYLFPSRILALPHLRLGNTLGLSGNGCQRLVSIRQAMARIRLAAHRRL